ncbi:MAG: HDOD domain-containing protein [Candidatus Thiodiazotropha sp.]
MIQRATSVSVAKVKKIPLLRNLPKRVQEYVLDQTHVEHLNANSVIASQGEAIDDVRFLIEGEVCISDDSGRQRRCSASGECSGMPLTETDPSPATVVAETAVDLLCLPRELYEAIKQLPPVVHNRSSQSIELMDTSGPEASLYWEFHEAIQEGELELPTLPDIAIRIAKVINDANTDSRDIARVVQADPTVAARIISVVNSAAYRGKSPIDNLPDAVSRLGRNVTHHLVISFVLCKLFHSRSQILKQRMVQMRQHVSYVAAICHELARVTPGLEPAQALLCGLLHDIGALAIISAARSKPELSENPQLLDQVIDSLKAEVGAMVLRKWEFPSYFVQVALHAEDWMEDISHSPDYVDLVVVAQLHSYIGTPRMSSLPRLDLVPAFHKLVLGKLTPRHSIGLLENAKEQIRELREMLALPSGK